jgi:GT2 family glycosyltransferase
MTSVDRPAVDVVVLTWNDGDVLGDAVASALASTDVDVRVLVVDNGSAIPPALPADDRVSLLRNATNIGVAAGRNVGVRAGSAPYVCLLDSDARLEAGTLSQLCRPLIDDPALGLTAPVFSGQHRRASAGRTPGLTRKGLRLAGVTTLYARPRSGSASGDSRRAVEFAIGACQVFPRRVYDAVGGIDETYFYGPEDIDFCVRIRRTGLQIAQIDTDGCHHPPRRRHRQVFTLGGARHALAVSRFLWRTWRLP